MSSVVKMVEDYVEEASFSNQDKKEVEVKTRFLQKLKEINKLSRDMEHEMKVSLKGDVLQIRMELEAGAFINEEISDELRREIYEEIFPEVEVKIVVEEEEDTADWMKRSFKTMNAGKERVICADLSWSEIQFEFRVSLNLLKTNCSARKQLAFRWIN